MDAGTTVAIVVAVGEFVAICFMVPMVGKVGDIEKKLAEIIEKIISAEDLNDKIDLKIYRHMNKCDAHRAHHITPSGEPKE